MVEIGIIKLLGSFHRKAIFTVIALTDLLGRTSAMQAPDLLLRETHDHRSGWRTVGSNDSSFQNMTTNWPASKFRCMGYRR